jgi:hypothetical protein
MSSRAAAAMYPALAKQEEQRRQAELRAKSGKSAEPTWAKSNHPLWAEPRRAPGFDRVPTLRRKK